MTISTFGWIVVGVTAWLVVATLVGVLIGRTIRQRDRQVPRDATTPPPGGIPAQGTDPDAGPAWNPRVAGRGRPRRH